MLKVKVMNVIIEQLDQMFKEYFEGKCVATTFSGSIVLIEDDMVTLLKNLQKMNLTKDSCFVHQIGMITHI